MITYTVSRHFLLAIGTRVLTLPNFQSSNSSRKATVIKNEASTAQLYIEENTSALVIHIRLVLNSITNWHKYKQTQPTTVTFARTKIQRVEGYNDQQNGMYVALRYPRVHHDSTCADMFIMHMCGKHRGTRQAIELKPTERSSSSALTHGQGAKRVTKNTIHTLRVQAAVKGNTKSRVHRSKAITGSKKVVRSKGSYTRVHEQTRHSEDTRDKKS